MRRGSSVACSSACGRVWRDLFTRPTRCRAGTVTYASEPSRLAGWLVLPCRRDYATRDDSSTHQSFSSKTRRVCYGGDTRTHVGLPFKLTSTDAHAALKKWTKRKPFRPWSLRDGNAHKPSLKTVFLPHWVFQCEISVKYRGVVGYDAGGGKVTWTAIDTWRDGGSTKYDSSSKETQICASFGHRRDLLSALHGKHVGSLPGRNKNANEELDDTRASSSKINLISMPDRVQASLDASKFGAGPPGQIHVERFSMKRSLAWELAFRRVRESEREKATELLKRNHKADAVRDVALDITLSPKRHVKAVLLPAFIAHFTHGEVRGPSGDASPRKHVAVVCGVTGNVVVDEDVVDVGKARTAAVVGGVFLPALCAHFCLGPEFAGIIAAQTALGSALAFAVAGAFARRAPVAERERVERVRVADETAAFAAAMRVGGAGDKAWMDESTQLRRDDAEWGRWKETDKQNWDETEREEWAANIWQWQRLRKREREERRAHLDAARFRLEEATRRDEEKERRWGPGWRVATGAGTGRGGGGGGRDTKGFYKLLGLTAKLADATYEDIKNAYRKEAMAWHPDKHQGDDEKKRAAKTFRELQKAYLVLGNKTEREVYDGL